MHVVVILSIPWGSNLLSFKEARSRSSSITKLLH